MKKVTDKKRLVLTKEQLKVLSDSKLSNVAGAEPTTGNSSRSSIAICGANQ